MHYLILFALSAFAAEPPIAPEGELRIDANQAAEILVDGTVIGQLHQASELRVMLEAGKHDLRVYTNGTPEDMEVLVPANSHLLVMVGRSGTVVQSIDTENTPVDAEVTSVAVQLRVSGSEPVRFYIERKRYSLSAGEQLDLTLAHGKHKVSARNEDGTLVWAHGLLTVAGSETIIIQLTEGRMPEVSGQGRFTSGG